MSRKGPVATTVQGHSLTSEDLPVGGLFHNPSQSTMALPARLLGSELEIAQAASHREVR